MIIGRIISQGSEEVRAALAAEPERARRAIRTALAWAMNDAVNHAREVGLGGGPGRLTSRHGQLGLAGSLAFDVQDVDGGVAGELSANTLYARIHELGGRTRPHVIAARRAKVLAFARGEGTTFARRVNHPGSNIPARPYLRPAIEHAASRLDEYLAAALARES